MNKKFLTITALAVLLLCFSVFAGSLEVNDPTFENGDHVYNGAATIDADTLQGNTAANFYNADATVMEYINNRETQWATDKIGGSGINRAGLSLMVSGVRDLFNHFDTVYDFLLTKFVSVEKYNADIAKLSTRIDALEAEKLGMSVDDYQKKTAKQCVAETGNACAYGKYMCYPNSVCYY